MADTIEVKEKEEFESEKYGFHALAGDEVLQVGGAMPQGFPQFRTQHLSISNERYAYVKSSSYLCIGPISQLSQALIALKTDKSASLFQASVEFDAGAPISHIAFSSDGAKLFASLAKGGLIIYDVDNMHTARREVQVAAVISMLPNPSDMSVALLTTEGDVLVFSDPGLRTIASGMTAISWSKKGKQLIAGTSEGGLEQYTPTGELKARLSSCNESLGPVHAIDWLENNLFLIAYMNPEQELAIYLLRRVVVDGVQVLQYTSMPNPSLPFGDTSHPAHFTFLPLSKSLVLTASSVSADLGLVSLQHETSISIDEDDQKALLRFSAERDVEVSLTGLAVQSDAINNQKLVWYIDNDGGCGAWQVRDDQDSLFDSTETISKSQLNSAPATSAFSMPRGSDVSTISPFAGFTSDTDASAKSQSPFSMTQNAMPKSLFGGMTELKADSSQKATASGPTNTSQSATFGKSAFGTSVFGNSAFGANSSAFAGKPFGGSVFGAANFGTNVGQSKSAFTGFGQPASAPLQAKELDGSKEKSTFADLNPPQRKPPPGLDSDDEDMQEDRLARLDEQEPSRVNDLDLDGAGLSLGQSNSPAATTKPVFDFTAGMSREGKEVSQTKENSSNAFGSFSFPQPQPGGFGFGNAKHVDPGKADDTKIDTPGAPRLQSATKQSPFNFEGFAKPAASDKTSGSAFGFGSNTSFGFGSLSSTNTPRSEPQAQSALPTLSVPDRKAEAGKDDAPADSAIPQSINKESISSKDVTSIAEELQVSVAEDAPLPPDPDVSDTLLVEKEDVPGGVDQKIVESHSSQDASKDELKQIPPFDFSAAGSNSQSGNTSDESFVKVSQESQADVVDEIEDRTKVEGSTEGGSGDDTQSGSREATEEEEEEDELSDDDQSASELDPDDSQQEWSETASQESQDDLEADDNEISEPESLEGGSAFRPKTPAFSSAKTSDVKGSPFADTSLLSAFGASPSPATGIAGPVFDFAGALRKKDPVPELSQHKPASFSFSPQSSLSTQPSKPFNFATSKLPTSRASPELLAKPEVGKISEGTLQNKPEAVNTGEVQNPVPSAAKVQPRPATDPAKVPLFGQKPFQFNSPKVSTPTLERASSPALAAKPTLTAKTTNAPIVSNEPAHDAGTEVKEQKTLVLAPYLPLTSSSVRSDQQGIARELDIVTQTLALELDAMGKNLRVVDTYLHEAPNFPQCLDNISRLKSDVDQLLALTTARNKDGAARIRSVSSMKSSMLALEGQKVKVQRLIRAQTDPAFAHSMKISSLGPEFLGQQKELRRRIANTEKELGELQSSLSLVKAKLISNQADAAATPTPEKISIALSKIMRVAVDKEREMERLQRRYVSMQANLPDESFRSSMSMSHRPRKSRSRLSTDESFDMSMSQLSLGFSPSRNELSRLRTPTTDKEIQEQAKRKREKMRLLRETLIKRGPLETIQS